MIITLFTSSAKFDWNSKNMLPVLLQLYMDPTVKH